MENTAPRASQEGQRQVLRRWHRTKGALTEAEKLGGATIHREQKFKTFKVKVHPDNEFVGNGKKLQFYSRSERKSVGFKEADNLTL